MFKVRDPLHTRQARYAWREVDRAEQPKRGAGERITDFHEIYSLFDEATIREQASRCMQCAAPACVAECPLHNRIPEWMALAAEGRYMEVANISWLTSSMPEICPRVCPQEKLCESACAIKVPEAPVYVGAIEKFINEYALAHGGGEVPVAPPNGKCVAVVGSEPGVMVGRHVTLTQLREEFSAVFLGIGALKPKAAGVPGTDLKGVIQGLPFLAQKNAPTALGLPPVEVKGKRVVVLGGGDSAMDCLRTAVRCGAADTVCVYRRDLANMPGVFARGDVVREPSLVVHAVRDGRKAAEAIHPYLSAIMTHPPTF